LNSHEKRLMIAGADPQDVAKGKQVILKAYRTSGPKGYWSKMLEFALEDAKKGHGPSAGVMAQIYAQLGERDEAVKWLDKAAQSRIDSDIFMLKVSPEWDSIRDDPRFGEIVKEIGLP